MSQTTESASLEDSLINLNNTLNKDQGIVNTSSAGRFLESPGKIDEQYREYASTHLIQDDITRFMEDLVESLNDPDEDRSIPGYIVGPFGYGKTSTAGKVWHQLEQNENYVTTPPIYFDELQSLVDAVYGWLRYKLNSEDHLAELEEIYERHLETNVEDIVKDTDIEADDRDDVHDQLQQLVQRGEIDVTFTVDNLLSFLSEANTLVKDAGYDGLVVIADELQQFISNAPSDKKAYSQLRDIAKSIALGLRKGDGLGLLFTMDDGLEGDLNVNADDVLARLSEQNVTIDLRNVYDREFPKRLWDSLAEKYGFEDQRYEVISEDALNALGQICERGKPLSNGPRTVVDILTIGIDHYLNTGETFDALVLANAYYKGTVRYKGDHIKQGMTSAINADVVDNESRENFIKICGVFPRGVPDDVLDKYDLREARDAVKNDLHGQHIITHEEGYTLKRLERDDEDRGIKDEIFTQFYQKYDTTDVHNDHAREIFQSVVLEEEIFEGKRGRGLNSWVTREGDEFSVHTGGVHKAVFKGSFNGDEYPHRHLAIVVGEDQDPVIDLAEDVDDADLTFAFVTDMSGDAEPHIERPADDLAVLYLDFMDELDDLPGGLQLLEDYMSPDDVNGHLLLSLYNFIEEWQKTNSVNPNQESQLEYVQGNLIEQSVTKLFGTPLNEDPELGVDPDSRRTIQAQKVIPTLFNRAIEDVYPEYETLFVSGNYDTFLEDYEGLLIGNEPDLQVSQKRGNREITADKQRLADGIGVDSVATAETRYRKVLESLVDVVDWDGEKRTIKLKLHPLEQQLKETIEEQNDEHLRYEEAYEIGAAGGYRTEEVDWALRLLEARQYINRYPEASTPYVELDEVAIDYTEVSERLESVIDLFETATSLVEDGDLNRDWSDADEIESKLSSLESELDGATDEDIELLDRVLDDVSQIEQQINSELGQIEAVYKERCRNTKRDLDGLSTASKPRGLQKSVEGASVTYHIHIRDLQEELTSEFESAQNDVSEAASELQSVLDRGERAGSDTVDRIQAYKQALNDAQSAESAFETKQAEIADKAQDYESWVNLAQEMGDLREKMGSYIQNHDDASQVEGLKNQLDELMSEIMSEFASSSSDSDGVLTNAGVYRSRFDEDIAARYEAITEADQQDFQYRRNVLENTVATGTEGRGQLRQTLSPRNPAESRQNLSADFARQLRENRGGIEEIREDIDTVRNKVEYTQMLNQVPDDPDSAPEAILEDLETFEGRIDRISRAIDSITLRDVIPLPDDDDKSDDFPKTDDELTLSIGDDEVEIGSELSDIRESVDDISTEVKRWRSISDVPPDLQYIHDELSSRKARDIEDILTTIGNQQSNGKQELNIDEFFEDLQELFEDNHITIEIKSEHRQS
jgi:hypothetical protein